MKNFTFKVLLLACASLILGNVYAQDTINLAGIDNADILTDTLASIPEGAIVLLQPGMTYNAGYAFDKSVILQSSDPETLNKPMIDCTVNFNFADGAMVDSIVFKNLEFFGEFDSRYVLNSNVAATIGKLVMDGCKIHDLRGILRMKDAGPGSLGTYEINNCVITKIRDYGVLTVDMNNWMVNNILITNSTISKARTFITSKNNTDILMIDGCTIDQVPTTGQRLFRWRESGQDNVTGGIMIKNTLWGPGWDEDATGSTAYDGYDGLGDTEWTLENTYVTNDVTFAEGKDTIQAFLDNVYADDASSDLWSYPDGDEFNFYDVNFPAIGTAGDPRWGVANMEGGLDWNFSDAAFNSLGDILATKTVLGLTIYASDAKKVTVDGSEKTFDDMSFTNRLKFNGSGGFDENGIPSGRVLAFDVVGRTTITVIGTSANSTDDRVLNIAAGNKDNVFGEFNALAGTVSKGMYSYMGDEPTRIYIYSANSGINLYYLKTSLVPNAARSINIDDAVVNIFPNPANDKVYVDFNRPIQVAIYNIAGSMLKSKLVQSNDDYINISDLQPGMYLIRSQFDSTFAKKLIKR